jgi:hypothetical protein
VSPFAELLRGARLVRSLGHVADIPRVELDIVPEASDWRAHRERVAARRRPSRSTASALDGFEELYPRYRDGRPRTFTLPLLQAIKRTAVRPPFDNDETRLERDT